MNMKLRKKIYIWYLATAILTLSLFFSSEAASHHVDYIQIILIFMITTVPILLFLEYSVLLRVFRILKYSKEEKNGYPIFYKDFGNDELTEIVKHINDQSNIIQSKTSKIVSLENILNNIFKLSPIMIIECSPDGNIKYLNDLSREYLKNRDNSSSITNNFFSLIVSKSLSFNLEREFKALTVEKPQRHRISKDIDDKWILWIFKALFDKHKKIREYSVIGIDITKEKEMEERLRILADNVSKIIIWSNKADEIEFMSDEISDIIEFEKRPTHLNDILLKVSEFKPGILQEMIDNCETSGCRISKKVRIFNVLENKYLWYEVTVKHHKEHGTLMTIDDIEDLISKSKMQEKNSVMNKFIYEAMSDLTSVDLVDISSAVNGFSKNLNKVLKSDFTGISLNIDGYSKLVVEDSDKKGLNEKLIKVLRGRRSLGTDNFVIFKSGDKDTPADMRHCMEEARVHSLIMSDISFNHTNIGFIFSGIYTKSYHLPEWDEVDGTTIKMSGRILGTVLRPVTKADSSNLDLNDIL